MVLVVSLLLGLAVFLYSGWEARRGGDWRARMLRNFALIALVLFVLAWLTD